MKRWSTLAVAVMVIVAAAAFAQQRGQGQRAGISVPPLGDGPFVFDTGEQHKIRVSVVTKGLSHPWSLAFLPDGNILITERAGVLCATANSIRRRLRAFRKSRHSHSPA
jgi:glucose/arabinose dehydrogenase